MSIFILSDCQNLLNWNDIFLRKHACIRQLQNQVLSYLNGFLFTIFSKFQNTSCINSNHIFNIRFLATFRLLPQRCIANQIHYHQAPRSKLPKHSKSTQPLLPSTAYHLYSEGGLRSHESGHKSLLTQLMCACFHSYYKQCPNSSPSFPGSLKMWCLNTDTLPSTFLGWCLYTCYSQFPHLTPVSSCRSLPVLDYLFVHWILLNV